MGYGGNFYIVNNSWGYSPSFFNALPDNFFDTSSGGSDASFAQYGAQLQGMSEDGRDGMGTIYVFAAGNGGNSSDVNQLNFQNSRYTIAVGATNESGEPVNFSSPGAAVLIATPGHDDIAATDRDGAQGYEDDASGPLGSSDYTIISGHPSPPPSSRACRP